MAGLFGLFRFRKAIEQSEETESKSFTITRLANVVGGGTYLTNPDQTALHLNSIVMGCVKFASHAFIAASLAVEEFVDDQWVLVEPHPLSKLIKRPNPYYSGSLLWQGTILSYMVDGNAYWWLGRNASGVVKEIWYLPHGSVRPEVDKKTGVISYYEYRANGKSEKILPQDIVHFRDGLDPEIAFPYGLSALKAVYRELLADNEISQYIYAIIKNMGVPGVIITPKNSIDGISEGTGELIANRFVEQFTSNGRGKPMIIDIPIDVQSPGFTPADLDISHMRKALEARVCAALGIHPTVLGLMVGLEHSTFSNMKEAHEMVYESFLIPMQSLLADELSVQLLDQLGDESTQRCFFDNSKVRVLQEDQDSLANRVRADWEAGLITRAEAKAIRGYAIGTNDEIYYTDLQAGLVMDTAKADVIKSAKLRTAERRRIYDEQDTEE